MMTTMTTMTGNDMAENAVGQMEQMSLFDGKAFPVIEISSPRRALDPRYNEALNGERPRARVALLAVTELGVHYGYCARCGWRPYIDDGSPRQGQLPCGHLKTFSSMARALRATDTMIEHPLPEGVRARNVGVIAAFYDVFQQKWYVRSSELNPM